MQAVPATKEVTMQRLLSRVRFDANGCWSWTGLTHTVRGKPTYGRITHDKKSWQTHRLMYSIAVGLIPEGLWVLHTCDNRQCINPEHLYLGTHTDNMADRDARGRTLKGDNHPRRLHPELFTHGEASPSAKLTSDEVRQIRAEYGPGVSYAHLGRTYGVTPRNIQLIVKRLKWAHI